MTAAKNLIFVMELTELRIILHNDINNDPRAAQTSLDVCSHKKKLKTFQALRIAFKWNQFNLEVSIGGV